MQYPGPPHDAKIWHGPWANRRNRPSARRFRLIFPVVFSLIIQLPSAFVTWEGRRPIPLHLPANQFWPALIFAIAGPFALLASRRWPGPTVAFVSAAACLDLFVVQQDTAPPYVALAFAIVFAVVRGARLWAWISVASAWVVSITAVLVFGSAWPPVRIAFTTFAILVLFGLAEAARTRVDRFAQFEQYRLQRRQSEVQAERVRIARELHDVLAHSLSQINVQAGVGLHLMDNQPDKARDALASIKETSKTALDEVRSVLGVLRADAGTDPDAPLVPEPNLSRLDGLAASVTAQGVAVTITGSPTGVLQATQLAIYRIVQESLTNVLRHANATEARVDIEETSGFYTVTVRDNGKSHPSTSSSDGRGLLGMRERAELLGGTLEAGPMPGGGFQVAAKIPVRTTAGTP
jgi:signal transduction histidine kinase